MSNGETGHVFSALTSWLENIFIKDVGVLTHLCATVRPCVPSYFAFSIFVAQIE